MTQPTAYQVTTDFSQEEANGVSGRGTSRTAALDAEFTNLSTTIGQILANLAIIQRDDTALADEIVTVPTLSSEVLALISSSSWDVRGPWVTSTLYYLGDVVSNGGLLYLCTAQHTSGVFATDLAANDWAQLTISPTAGVVSFTPTSTISAITVQAAIQELDAEVRPSQSILNRELFNGL